MAEEKSTGTTEKKHIGAELVIPVAALAFALYYFSTIINWPWNPEDQFVPWTAQVSAFFIGAILIALIVILIVRSAVAVIGGEADLGMEALVAPRALIPKRLCLFALTLGFIVLVQWGGFTLTVFVFLCAAMLLLTGGRRIRLVLLLALGLSAGGYLLFILAFDTRYPDGPIEHLLQPLESMMDRGF